MNEELESLWKSALAEIELEVSRANFATWFQNTLVIDKNDGVIVIGVPNGFTKEWLSTKYNKSIIRVLRNLSPEVKNVEYIISSSPAVIAKKAKRAEEEASSSASAKETQMEIAELYIDPEANLNPRYTFDNFIVGSFNELAYSAGIAITKNLGTAYNPLFVYGGVGLGKTHLLQAIGNEVKRANPNYKVQYITSEKFTLDYVNSVQSNTPNIFKEKYRKYDLLIVDDIQFFSGKEKTQEEFFHVFNTIYGKNKQIIFSSDRAPKQIEGLEERLRSRFESGMMVDITQPEFESRLAILKAKTEMKSVALQMEILEYIASAVQDNIRELEGALNSIVGHIKMMNKSLTLNEVKEIIKKNAKPKKIVTVNQLIKSICDFYCIEERHLFEKTRRKDVVMPRQVAMYLLREDFNSSYPFIGQKFGGKDHTTVIHAYEKISALIKGEGKTKEEIEQLRKIIYESV